MRAVRVSQPNQEPVHYIQRSSLCLAAQGAKIAMIGGDTYAYEAGQMALYSVDVLMAGRVTRASYSEPYLLFVVDLDAEKIGELTPKVFPHGVPQPRDTRSLYVADADAQIIDAAARLLELMTQPVEAEPLAPLVRDEILIRLLRSPLGSRIAQIGQTGSSMQRIANAVSWLRTNFDRPANIEELAKPGEHERHVVPSAIQGGHQHEPSAIPENASAAGGSPADADFDDRCGSCWPPT
ncbi:MAG TPA: AraC family transcriptional regulator [Thermoanaerobaculia bacterium]|nr:AraC family transcriptional regulator [Thermoanaerobaculia bacterium]